MNVILIGARGVGKSKVSRALSKKTEMPVLSTDSLAVYEAGGISIPEFVKEKGWKEFRKLETQILQNLQKANNVIIDCGGGILFDLDPEGQEIASELKMDLLRSLGRIIYLEKDIEELLEKVKGDKTRPDLSKSTPYRSILEKRLPIYRQTAHKVVKADTLSKDEIAGEILDWLGLRK